MVSAAEPVVILLVSVAAPVIRVASTVKLIATVDKPPLKAMSVVTAITPVLMVAPVANAELKAAPVVTDASPTVLVKVKASKLLSLSLPPATGVVDT